MVGITDAGRDSLLSDTLATVEAAEVLCGGERHLAFFPEHQGERVVVRAGIETLVDRLRGEPRRVVVLASGDPGCFGIGPLLAQQLGQDRVSIVPNVGAVQLACARLGIGWHDAVVLSAHGRPIDNILPAALRASKAVILTDARNTPAVIAQTLLEAGSNDALADVFEHVGGPAERHYSGHLSDLIGREVAALNLMVIRRTGPPAPWPLGLPEDAYAHRGGQITKSEVRAVSLARLRLHERSVVWDVGAGCGSVSIEAAAIARQGEVFAVERADEQIAFLTENRRRFGAGNIVIVPGEAPDACAALPDPDAVFVGGSGGRLREILEHALLRIRGQGCLVVNLATLDHLGETLAMARETSWPADVVQINISRGSPVGDLTRLDALNPVFVVTLQGSPSGVI